MKQQNKIIKFSKFMKKEIIYITKKKFYILYQVAEVLSFIFDSPDGRYPSIEELVLCDLFRNIDLREMRGTCIPVSIC